MHVLLVMVGGVLLLGVFLLFGRLWSVGQSQLPTALLAFIATWLLVTLATWPCGKNCRSCCWCSRCRPCWLDCCTGDWRAEGRP